MKIRMLQNMEGPVTSRAVGGEYEVDDNEAISCIKAGFAEPVRAVAPETATPRGKKPERAAK
jgi:hypothetical protein